ncbi:T9SS type A sorting domain-containing protein [Flavobacterium sp. N3904]|uniref:DUF7619 domain-containing protein n=1 Tax=Flavobacterium sp. N3904 TaxID=2986835 RepID=UPI0022247CAB|nr:T9SS type A sorting domain-containing protein [Flavobacterium sp. N3904]
MKKIYFFVLSFCFFNGLNAQVINFPDVNFKAQLVDSDGYYSNIGYNSDYQSIRIDANFNGEIEVSEALNIYGLDLESFSNISDLTGIEYFSNLFFLNCNYNKIKSLNLNGLSNLNYLRCTNNLLTSLDVRSNKNLYLLECASNEIISLQIENLSKLTELVCYNNKLTSLDLTGLININKIDCSGNQINSLDFSSLDNIRQVICVNNNLTALNLKNGHIDSIAFYGNPNLKYICTDEEEVTAIEKLKNDLGYATCNINTYCSFNPGGVNYIINGTQKYDGNKNGCDVSDLPAANIKFIISDGTETGTVITNDSGNYSIKVKEGTYTITPIIENPNYFSIFPTSFNVTFPTGASPFIQDFCITPTASHKDLEITLIPLGVARPGFDTDYKLVYKNKGNVAQSGTVNLAFDDAVLDLVISNPVVSSQNANNLSWNFINLKPFETREITFTLNVNSPMETPAVNSGAILHYSATINSSDTDEIPSDNTFVFDHKVVGSFDPNDKTCLEGDIITPSLIGEYVHYLIRFENTGNYPAQNIVVKDMIDLSKFDISTLVPTDASHSYTTKISEGNKVEFILENVNLPFDDASNDGYVAFKIKTKPTLVVGDSFDNEANIYFDYNFPVLTNKATSTFKTLGTQDFEFSNYFKVYPIPAYEVLNISAIQNIEIQSIAVYDILGQMVLALPNLKDTSKIDVSHLSTGNYFINIKSDKGSSSLKFIKK